MTTLTRFINLQDRLAQIKELEPKVKLENYSKKRISLLVGKITNIESSLSNPDLDEEALNFLFQEAEGEASIIENFIFEHLHTTMVAKVTASKLH